MSLRKWEKLMAVSTAKTVPSARLPRRASVFSLTSMFRRLEELKYRGQGMAGACALPLRDEDGRLSILPTRAQ